MVLQRDQPIPVWGWADPNEQITIKFAGKTFTTKAGSDTKWRLDLPIMSVGGPYTMTIRGKKNTLVINDILLGDVWLGSGQSNMEWRMQQLLPHTKNDIASANYPMIRLFDVRDTISPSPLADVSSDGWRLCSPQSIATFSAVAYFYGRDLYKRYQVPIGLITSDWGGTQIEAWMSPAALRPFPEFAVKLASVEENPGGSLEQVKQAFGRKLAEWQRTYTAADRGFADKNKPWFATDLATTNWRTIELPGHWEQSGTLPDFDGVVWVRKQITLTSEQAGKPLVLHLARVDDVDSTWFNGQKVGGTSPYSAVRQYRVPGHLIKAGPNTIAIRMLDTGGGGGLYGNPNELYATIGQDTISLAGPWAYQVGIDTRDAPKAPNLLFSQNSLTALFNSMIAPLIPYALKGVIWYQGEANADRAYQYRQLFPDLIRDWRTRWGYAFPFLFVQLAGFMNDNQQPADYMWAELREAQTMTLSLPKTGMAVAIDIGDSTNIHPVNKQEVGRRLALAARRVAYNEAEVVSSGPVFKSMTVEGRQVRVTFNEVGTGLTIRDKYGYVRGFSVAGPDHIFHWAKGTLNGNELLLNSEQVPNPVAVRYNWGNTPDGNLYNREGLPAVPFRTDDWPGLTFGRN
ncbi:sialate O-acetylesterase (plasmid) [Spirosoma sp. SC4-14]|uniref:sialate O-acetylesterase n=1 Tax=Spirosoma sp. SC4-14 TaxID=3128900 RepID=UPI0030D0688A